MFRDSRYGEECPKHGTWYFYEDGCAECAPIERRPVDTFPVEVNCPTCRRTITLHFNGGELDEATCCGHKFELEHTQTYLVVTKE